MEYIDKLANIFEYAPTKKGIRFHIKKSGPRSSSKKSLIPDLNAGTGFHDEDTPDIRLVDEPDVAPASDEGEDEA